jgi:hypothetical protein
VKSVEVDSLLIADIARRSSGREAERERRRREGENLKERRR